jgi:hypothetical protein
VAVKEPEAARERTVFWTTPSGNLTVENPRQTKLPLREVPPPVVAERDRDDVAERE